MTAPRPLLTAWLGLSVRPEFGAWCMRAVAEAELASGDLGTARRWADDAVSATTGFDMKFYAAEALAYLDDTAAAGVLAEVARNEPAFRVNALAALSAMDDASAYEGLRSLLEVKSAETRYGAFRALWAMNQHDALLHDIGRSPSTGAPRIFRRG